MDLSLLKQLEDIKRELEVKRSELDRLTRIRKEKVLSDVAREFDQFFSAQGFNIEHSQNHARHRAVYGSLSVEIVLPSPDDTFIGAYSRIDLSVSNGTHSQYMVLVVEASTHPITTRSIGAAPQTEDEQIRRQIDDALRSLEEVNRRIETFESIQWVYVLTDEERKTRRDNPYFQTFTEVLNHLFRQN